MAYLPDVMKGMVDKLDAHLAGAGFSATVGSEWPSADLRTKAGKGSPLVAVIHRYTDYKDLIPFDHYETEELKSIKSVFSDTSINDGQSVTLTIQLDNDHEAPRAGDLVSCIFRNGHIDKAATYKIATDDTLSDIAFGLAAAIETELPSMVAENTGAVITITSGDTNGYSIESYTGNTADVAVAVKYAVRSMQVNFWCKGLSLRGLLQKSIESFMAGIDRATGFNLQNGEWVDLKFLKSTPVESDTDKDVFTDVFIFQLCHWTDVLDKKYTVVAPIGEHGTEVTIEY